MWRHLGCDRHQTFSLLKPRRLFPRLLRIVNWHITHPPAPHRRHWQTLWSLDDAQSSVCPGARSGACMVDQVRALPPKKVPKYRLGLEAALTRYTNPLTEMTALPSTQNLSSSAHYLRDLSRRESLQLLLLPSSFSRSFSLTPSAGVTHRPRGGTNKPRPTEKLYL